METKPVMLMILDGFGINENTDGNAVYVKVNFIQEQKHIVH